MADNLGCLPPPSAGWHPDPTGQHALRYWDGATWTTHTADGQPPRRQTHWLTTERKRIALLLAAGAMAVGTLLPWVTVTTVFGAISANGVGNGDRDGVFVIGAAMLVAIGHRGRWFPAVAAAASAALCAFDLSQVQRLLDDGNDVAIAEVGVGLYVSLAASVAALVLALIRPQRAIA